MSRELNNCLKGMYAGQGEKGDENMDDIQNGGIPELEQLRVQIIKIVGETENVKFLKRILGFVKGMNKYEKKADVHMQKV